MSRASFQAGLAAGIVSGMRFPMVVERKAPVAYLIFASTEPFTIGVDNATKNWDGILYYSTNAANWNEWNGATTIASAMHDGEQKIYMCGRGNTVITGGDVYARWVLNGNDIRCEGNIENLLDYETVANGEHPVMGDFCYYGMFNYYCTALVTAPLLPATTLSRSCYGMMFRMTSITTAPNLPATTLAVSCYASMFQNCKSMTDAPALPATALADRCYNNMFYGCSGLITLPKLPATTLTTECYGEMFRNCTSIKLSKTQTGEYVTKYRIPVSGTGTTGSYSLSGMFTGTSGAFTGTPNINTTYYTSNTVI